MTDTIDEIRARHEAWDEVWQLRQAMSPKTSVDSAHTDRATLLRALDAAQEELSTWQSVFPELAKKQEPLGAEFEAAIGDPSTLYET